MAENEEIVIRAVENGWIVQPMAGEMMAAPLSDTKVFRSMNELNRFVSEHFTYRGKNLESDT